MVGSFAQDLTDAITCLVILDHRTDIGPCNAVAVSGDGT